MTINRLDNTCMHFFKVTDAMTGEIVCGNCGVVLFEKAIDFGPENTAQTTDEYQKNARTGQKMSLKMADMGLSTLIQAQNKDSSGKSLSVQNKRSFYRLRMWDRNSRSALTKQSYIKAFTFLDGIRSKLGLPEHVVEKSAYLFRKLEQKGLLHGRSSQSVLYAVVYMACRVTDTPRTLKDISDAAGIKKKVIQRVYRLLSANLDVVQSASYSPGEFVSRISSEAGISEKTKLDAIGPTGKLIGVDITDKMLDQARKRIEENGWKNVELVLSDMAEYKFPDNLDGIFSVGALTYSREYDKIIKRGYDALKTGKNFAIMDYKMSQGPAKIFAPLLVYFTKPFGADKVYIERRVWESIEKYFEKSSFEEGSGGYLYVSVGTKTK